MFDMSVAVKYAERHVSYIKRIFPAKECFCGMVRESNTLDNGKGLG
jgi:hypothetical protein